MSELPLAPIVPGSLRITFRSTLRMDTVDNSPAAPGITSIRRVAAHLLEDNRPYFIKIDTDEMTKYGKKRTLVLQHGDFHAKMYVPPLSNPPKESLIGRIIRKTSFPSIDSQPHYGKNYRIEFL